MTKICVTGGAGYIGSHTVLELLLADHEVVVVDNLSNSSRESLDRVATLAGRAAQLAVGDIRDSSFLDATFVDNDFDAVIHFAGLKAVGESVAQPVRYYDNNVAGTVALLEAMKNHGVRNLVFSSSATVYGDPESLPLVETARLHALNPYGRTKLIIEEILRDLAAAEPDWHICMLRYFNPVGAHESGTIGEDPADIPNNLMPYVMQVAVGRLESLPVFGNDYDTPDGTCVRDYIHVTDLALGHLAALEHLPLIDGCDAFNLGTGHGYSVMEVIEAAGRAVGKPITHHVAPRRPGDAPLSYSDATKAKAKLGWAATLDIDRMCVDHWRWQSQNPAGYGQ